MCTRLAHRAAILLVVVSATLQAQPETRIGLINLSEPLPTPPSIVPGYFRNNLTATGTEIFNAEPYRFNCLRTFDLNWKLRTTLDHASFLAAVRDLRGFHEAQARRTDVLVIQINGMPRWLSSSSDTTRVWPEDNVRIFETVKPADYARWDSLMRDMAAIVRQWDCSPYYELWNEPDLEYWSGTEAELIELYRHTAIAITSADPEAKVGGFGMNAWQNGVGRPQIGAAGFLPDSLVEPTATLSHLIDTCADAGVPLDFVSWHSFTTYAGSVQYGYDFLRRKLASRGLDRTLQILTEFNTSSSYRERKWHAPYLLVQLDRMKSWPGFHHAFAAYQDFAADREREFFGEWGSISRSGLIKPVHSAFFLLQRLSRPGVTWLTSNSEDPFTLFASRAGDTLMALVTRYDPPPLHAGFEVLLFGDARLNTNDLLAAGYGSTAEIDSTLRGLLPPRGDARTVAAVEAAREVYLRAQAQEYASQEFRLVFSGLRNGARGFLCRLDSGHNNTIVRFDSLLAAGFTRAQAISTILADQSLRVSAVNVTDSTMDVTTVPNGIIYVEVVASPDPAGIAELAQPTIEVEALPNPFQDNTTIRITVPSGTRYGSGVSGGDGSVSLRIYDVLGQEVVTLHNGPLAAGRHDFSFAPRDEGATASGWYRYRLTTHGGSRSGTIVMAR